MENEILDWLAENIPQNHERIHIGIGDDAAVLNLPTGHSQKLVVTSDSLIQGVHFDERLTMQQVGRKALAVNLSDLAAMAALPHSAIISLCLPRNFELQQIKQLYSGILELAQQFDCPVVGGDTNCGSSQLVISVTAMGTLPNQNAWRLDGAQTGDCILVSGSFGNSIEGKHYSFEPRVKLAQRLASKFQINAATDVSDGLSLDLSRICNASKLGFRIEEDAIPISAAAVKQSAEHPALQAALSDGEDFELILACSMEEWKRIQNQEPTIADELSMIGQFQHKRSFELVNTEGQVITIEPAGYIH